MYGRWWLGFLIGSWKDFSILPGGQRSRFDVTVKSTVTQLGGALAMYLQNMIH